MTHADDKELTLLLRGGLSESEKAKVMEHIAECDECADRMACLTLDMAAVDPPAGINEDILAAAAKENTREKRRQDNLLMYSVRVVAGICAALVMIFSGAFRHITKINDIDMSKINDKSRSISQSIDESFSEFKQKISDLGGIIMNKKNKILFFLFSLIPGAAHMYIGLVKRGLVIMLALVAGAGLAMMADTPAFLLVLPVLWFYSFFDAWNKYHLPEDKLAKVQDDFLFFLNAMPENVRSDPRFKKVASANVLKVGGIVAIIAGAYLIWDQIIVRVLIRLLSDTGAEILSQISYKLPQVAVAVILIVVGIKLISHKKREQERKNNEEEDK